jgi:hypothetical protein
LPFAQNPLRLLLLELSPPDGGSDVEGQIPHLGANESSDLRDRSRRARVAGAPTRASA